MKRIEQTILLLSVGLLLLTIVFNGCVVSNPQLFSKAQPTTDTTYGYTADNPLLIKNGDMYSSMGAEKYFLQHLTTLNGERLLYVSRGSFSNPKYHSTGLENRYTHQAIGGGGPILDEYTFLVENRGDTIKLYVNVYKSGTISVPVGLKYNP